MATFRAVFGNSREGRGGVWRPQYANGEPVILDEVPDLEASDANHSVVIFTVPDDPTSVYLMEWALEGNEEVFEWEIVAGNRYIVATQQVTEEAPRQTDAGASGMAYQAGENVVVYFDPVHDWYGYYFEGVSPDGNAFDTDDVDGFKTFEEALDAARDQAQEMASNEAE